MTHRYQRPCMGSGRATGRRGRVPVCKQQDACVERPCRRKSLQIPASVRQKQLCGSAESGWQRCAKWQQGLGLFLFSLTQASQCEHLLKLSELASSSKAARQLSDACMPSKHITQSNDTPSEYTGSRIGSGEQDKGSGRVLGCTVRLGGSTKVLAKRVQKYYTISWWDAEQQQKS